MVRLAQLIVHVAGLIGSAWAVASYAQEQSVNLVPISSVENGRRGNPCEWIFYSWKDLNGSWTADHSFVDGLPPAAAEVLGPSRYHQLASLRQYHGATRSTPQRGDFVATLFGFPTSDWKHDAHKLKPATLVLRIGCQTRRQCER